MSYQKEKRIDKKKEYVAIQENQKSINNSVQTFRRDVGCSINDKASTIIEMLIYKGFERIKTNGTHYLKIEKDKFEEMIKNSNDDSQ